MSNSLKIHILGAGAIGSLIAYEIKHRFPSVFPILLLRQESPRISLTQSPLSVSKIKNGHMMNEQVKASWAKPRDMHDQIENLVITTKSYQTITAIRPYISQIGPNTNILILQNGMGMTKSLLDTYWTGRNSRPNMFEGITTHGAYMEGTIVQHVGQGSISISEVPGNNPELPEHQLGFEELPDMIKYFLHTEALNASYVNYNEFLLMQMEKLIINCCVNALTALFDCKNGELLYSDQTRYMWKKIIYEAKGIIVKEYTNLSDIESANQCLDVDRLLSKVIEVVNITKENSSSMRQDVRNLRSTEIENINGYIVYLARKHSINAPVNQMLTNLIKCKLAVDRGIDRAAAEKVIAN